MEQTLELNAAKKTIHIFTKAAKRNKKVKKIFLKRKEIPGKNSLTYNEQMIGNTMLKIEERSEKENKNRPH